MTIFVTHKAGAWPEKSVCECTKGIKSNSLRCCIHVEGFSVNQHFPLARVRAIMFLLYYVPRSLLRKCVNESTFSKKTSVHYCVFLLMCEVVVWGLWNLFHKAPLVGSSLLNTNGSFLRCSKWYKSGLIVQPLLFVLLSFFFSSPLSCRAPIGLHMCFFCVCVLKRFGYFWLWWNKRRDFK